MKTVYHIEVAKLGTSLSGGETSMLELIKYLSTKHKNVIITTDNGISTYRKSLPKSKNIKYITIKSYERERKSGALLSYIHRLFLIKNTIRGLVLNDKDVIICHSEFFPNSITHKLLTKKNKNTKSICYFHMRAPRLFRGYEGEYDGKIHMPNLRLINYHLNQYLYWLLMPNYSVIVTVNPCYLLYLTKKYPKNSIVVLKEFGGVESEKQRRSDKNYDVLWLGRFHAQKGLGDLVEIVSRSKRQIPDIKVAVVGGGSLKVRHALESAIFEHGLSDNIELIGEVTGDKKYDYYAQSKVFIMTSHYESYGLVILEAMSFALPIIAYTLPVYDVFKQGITKVENTDITRFSSEVVNTLIDIHIYRNRSSLSLEESTRHSWVECSKQVEEIFI